MNWFYAQNGQQAGPVADEELAHLVQSGIITPTTLVWHSGLAGWQPYSAVSATLPVPVGVPVGAGAGGYAPVQGGLPGGMPAPGGQAVCSQCGGVFPGDEVVRVGNFDVCGRCKPILLQKLQQGVANVGMFGAPTLALAGFWIRFGAAVLDALILVPFYIVYYVIYFALFGSTFSQAFSDPQHYQPGAGFQLASTAFSFVTMFVVASYSAFCLSKWGGTPGKLICNLRVTRPDGQRITFLRGFGRYFAKYISKFILCLGYLFIVFDDQKRALHDYICDTRVSFK